MLRMKDLGKYFIACFQIGFCYFSVFQQKSIINKIKKNIIGEIEREFCSKKIDR
jgi:hypothetical protein